MTADQPIKANLRRIKESPGGEDVFVIEPQSSEDGKRLFLKLYDYSMKRFETLFKDSGNGIHAWEAYLFFRRAARTMEVTLPVWVLDYLDRSASGLLADETRSGSAIATALGLSGRGPSALSKARKESRRLEVVQNVLAVKSANPEMKDLDVFVRVGEQMGIPTRTVQNAYYFKVRERPVK